MIGEKQDLPETKRPIAVVDDNSDDLFFLKRELAFLFGKTPILTFRGGANLLHYLQDHFHENDRPWLILLDLHMSGMDGFRTLELLQCKASSASIPVIVVSGTLDRHEISAVFRQGVQGFVPKPVSRWQFIKTLNHAFHGMDGLTS